MREAPAHSLRVSSAHGSPCKLVPRGTRVSPAVDFPTEGLTGRTGDEPDAASTPSTRGPGQVLPELFAAHDGQMLASCKTLEHAKLFKARHEHTLAQIARRRRATTHGCPRPRRNSNRTTQLHHGAALAQQAPQHNDAPREPPGVRGRPGPALLVSGTINKRWRDNKARASSPEGMHFEEGPAFNSNHEGLPRFRSGRGLCRKS